MSPTGAISLTGSIENSSACSLDAAPTASNNSFRNATPYRASTNVPATCSIAEESGHYTVVEPIIEEGQSDRYRHAVQWLRYAGKAARAAGELDAWRGYVETLRDEHYRKYTLRPMLEGLLDEF